MSRNLDFGVYIHVYGKFQRGQCMPTPGGYLKSLTLAQAQKI